MDSLAHDDESFGDLDGVDHLRCGKSLVNELLRFTLESGVGHRLRLDCDDSTGSLARKSGRRRSTGEAERYRRRRGGEGSFDFRVLVSGGGDIVSLSIMAVARLLGVESLLRLMREKFMVPEEESLNSEM